MRRAVRWIAIAALIAPVHLVVVLAVIGVPKPPAITAEHVGRVGWRPLLDNAGQLWASRQSKSLVAWMPDGSGVLMRGKRMLLDARLHTLSAPGADPVYLPQIPRNATPYGAPGREYMILAWDIDGDEEFRLYRWDLADSQPVLLTSESERAAFGAFEPDGHRIAYASTRRNGKDFDVYLMDARDPASDERILELEGMWGVVGWSPTADELLLTRVVSNVENELYVLNIGERSVRRLTEPTDGPVLHGSAQWSRDGSGVYYSSNRGTEFSHLRRLDLRTGEETILSDEIPWDVTSIQQTGDGGLLLIAVNEDGSTRHYTSDPLGEEFILLDLFSTGGFSATLHPDEPVMMVSHTDPHGVGRGYTYDLRSGELTLWAGGETSASDVDTPAPRLVRYPTFDEVDGEPRRIPAFVYPGVGAWPRPVLIDIHGGPEAQARRRTAPSATQRDGITLITPNVRGSTGYGRTFASLDDQYLREDAVRDIGALLDWIDEQPDLDAGRVAVTGGSYGGYMVLASLVHFSPRLRCGIDIVGVSNFVTFLENTADYRRDNRRAEYGDERDPAMRQFLESISPLNNAERITSRLMVVQGANDPRVPVGESRQLVERVRGNGRDVSYVEGANEGHGFRHPWNALWAGLAQQELIRECLLER
jgi:dipeptidyl aminopeptidase/acylaminoacyl peptidase